MDLVDLDKFEDDFLLSFEEKSEWKVGEKLSAHQGPQSSTDLPIVSSAIETSSDSNKARTTQKNLMDTSCDFDNSIMLLNEDQYLSSLIMFQPGEKSQSPRQSMSTVENILEEDPPDSILVESAKLNVDNDDSATFSCISHEDQVLAESSFLNLSKTVNVKVTTQSIIVAQSDQMKTENVQLEQGGTTDEEESNSSTPKDSRRVSIIDRFVMDSPNVSPTQNYPRQVESVKEEIVSGGAEHISNSLFKQETAQNDFKEIKPKVECSLMRKPSFLRSPSKKISAFKPIALTNPYTISTSVSVPEELPGETQFLSSQQSSPNMRTSNEKSQEKLIAQPRTRTSSVISISAKNKSLLPVASNISVPTGKLSRAATMRIPGKFQFNSTKQSTPTSPILLNQDSKRLHHTPESKSQQSKFIKPNTGSTKIPVPASKVSCEEDGKNTWGNIRSRIQQRVLHSRKPQPHQKDLLSHFDKLNIK